MTYFSGIATLEALKTEYRRLCMEHHPDRGGDTVTMQNINIEFDTMFKRLQNAQNAQADAQRADTSYTPETYVKRSNEAPEAFRAVITTLCTLDGITVELCGTWIWISGETYTHRMTLKSIGCRWHSDKKMWYWHYPEDNAIFHKHKRMSMEEIRETFGSTEYTTKKERGITKA